MRINSYCEEHTWHSLYQPRLDGHKRKRHVVNLMNDGEEKERIKKIIENEILLEEVDIQLDNIQNDISRDDSEVAEMFLDDYNKLQLTVETYTTNEGLIQLKEKYKNTIRGFLVNDIDRCIESLALSPFQ